ncbi:hypothetical protein FE634_12125 [Nocardioides dongxiaopingii]|uniref:hypothetical protein n=1 Tax=Nocardioides sp. S-1144 TaxID=2582905 RepID=UPI00110E7EE4|nr:hypothetical protein [Nocardioides sp. S-1144]QCW50953.1 hypothetical protein FE634_12125 [Nocardioides sp. S-1144]
MDQDWSVPGWAVLSVLLALVLLVAVLVVALLRSRARTTASLLAARNDAAALQAQVDAIEARLAAQAHQHERTTRDEQEYVITRLGQDQPEPEQAPAPVVGGPLFADLVLRESAVQGAALAAGLRRALAPESRHRIRHAMKREVKRSRKQRRTDLRRARRQAA